MNWREQFEKEVHKNNPGLVPSMPDYIKWLEKKLDDTQKLLEDIRLQLKDNK